MPDMTHELFKEALKDVLDEDPELVKVFKRFASEPVLMNIVQEKFQQAQKTGPSTAT